MLGLSQFFSSAEEPPPGPSLTVIAERTTVQGTAISGGGDLRIEGIVRADISVEGRVYVAPKAEVYGEVRAQTIRVDGFVRGQLCAVDTVTLTPQAEVYATLLADTLRIEEGAQFWGTVQALDHAPSPSSLSSGDKVPALSVPSRAATSSDEEDGVPTEGTAAADSGQDAASDSSSTSEHSVDEDDLPYGFQW